MKKFLPRTRFAPKGFTLIELMIVISIIAILSVVGMVIYGSVQKNSRDARRRADIDAIAKAMEANYVATTGRYATLDDSFFSSGKIPVDPSAATSCSPLVCCSGTVCGYCVTQGATPQPGAACTSTKSVAKVGMPTSSFTYWTICANLETPVGSFYCRSNQQ